MPNNEKLDGDENYLSLQIKKKDLRKPEKLSILQIIFSCQEGFQRLQG